MTWHPSASAEIKAICRDARLDKDLSKLLVEAHVPIYLLRRAIAAITRRDLSIADRCREYGAFAANPLDFIAALHRADARPQVVLPAPVNRKAAPAAATARRNVDPGDLAPMSSKARRKACETVYGKELVAQLLDIPARADASKVWDEVVAEQNRKLGFKCP